MKRLLFGLGLPSGGMIGLRDRYTYAGVLGDKVSRAALCGLFALYGELYSAALCRNGGIAALPSRFCRSAVVKGNNRSNCGCGEANLPHGSEDHLEIVLGRFFQPVSG